MYVYSVRVSNESKRLLASTLILLRKGQIGQLRRELHSVCARSNTDELSLECPAFAPPVAI